MSPINKIPLTQIKIQPYFISLAIAWSFIVFTLSVTGFLYIKKETVEKAKNEARLNFTKDQMLRFWISSHGGIYVPATQKTPANDYLSHVVERDITTPSGRQLTLMNPAYAMRQIADVYYSMAGIRVHITGLNYFRPETAPDNWEKTALIAFENGAKEIYEIDNFKDKPFMRLMRPMITKVGCLKCHGHQGYKKGDVRGGVSVSVPMTGYYVEIRKNQLMLGSFLFILWGTGLTGLGLTATKMKRNIRVQNQTATELQKTYTRVEKFNSLLKKSNKTLKKTKKELLNREKQLIQNEKLASIGILVSGIAHEINNPNNFITFNLPILKDYLEGIMPIVDKDAEKNPELEFFYMPYDEFRQDLFKLLENVQHGSERISAIIEDLKEFSRTDHDKIIDHLEIKPLIEKVLTFTRSKIKRSVSRFEIDLPPSIPPVKLNPRHLEQVLINILINAAQTFDDNDYESARIDFTIRVNIPDKGLEFEIKDNGCGMSRETLNRIFLPFFTTKSPDQGTGLGLYICHNLVERMGGLISVDSKKGVGSVFLISFSDIFSNNTLEA